MARGERVILSIRDDGTSCYRCWRACFRLSARTVLCAATTFADVAFLTRQTYTITLIEAPTRSYMVSRSAPHSREQAAITSTR